MHYVFKVHLCCYICVCVSGNTDLLEYVQAGEKGVLGVRQVNGFCKKRPPTEAPDVAYKITRKASLSVPTKDIFPGE